MMNHMEAAKGHGSQPVLLWNNGLRAPGGRIVTVPWRRGAAGLLRSPGCLLFAGVRGEECRKSGPDSGGVSAVPSLMPSGGVTKNRSGGLYINIQAHFLTF